MTGSFVQVVECPSPSVTSSLRPAAEKSTRVELRSSSGQTSSVPNVRPSAAQATEIAFVAEIGRPVTGSVSSSWRDSAPSTGSTHVIAVRSTPSYSNRCSTPFHSVIVVGRPAPS